MVIKLYDDDYGFDKMLVVFNKSLGKLGMEYVDLYLMYFLVFDNVIFLWSVMVKL